MANKFILPLAYLALLLGLSVFAPKVKAQSQSISIYPPVFEFDATPPSSPNAPLVIQNNNNEEIKLQIQLIPIKQSDATGNINLIPELINSGFYPYYKDKIQFLIEGKKTNVVELQPLEAKEIIVNVNLEKGDPPGDYYYSVVFISQGKQPEETSLSRIPAGIATNLLLSVGPYDKATGGITEFKTSSVKSSGPVEFSLKVHNGSKHLIQPEGEVKIYNLFGKQVGKVTILPQFILSNSDRYLLDETQATGEARIAFNEEDNKPKIVWQEKFLLGIYKANAIIRLEENGKPIEAITYFIAFPLYFFFGIAIVIFITLSIYIRVRKKI